MRHLTEQFGKRLEEKETEVVRRLTELSNVKIKKTQEKAEELKRIEVSENNFLHFKS